MHDSRFGGAEEESIRANGRKAHGTPRERGGILSFLKVIIVDLPNPHGRLGVMNEKDQLAICEVLVFLKLNFFNSYSM